MSARAARSSRLHGFTLIELMVALGIAAALLSTVPFAAARAHEAMAYRSTVRHIVADLQRTRLDAMRSGQSSVFGIDLDNKRFGVVPDLDRTIPSPLRVGLVVAERELTGGSNGGSAGGVAGIRFHPDGGASGGAITLTRPGGGGVRITVDWLLGRVHQTPLTVLTQAAAS